MLLNPIIGFSCFVEPDKLSWGNRLIEKHGCITCLQNLGENIVTYTPSIDFLVKLLNRQLKN